MNPTKKPMTDAEYLASPDEWSRWPILPVIRGDKPSVGIVIESSRGLLLYEGVNMFGTLSDLREADGLLLTETEILERRWRID